VAVARLAGVALPKEAAENHKTQASEGAQHSAESNSRCRQETEQARAAVFRRKLTCSESVVVKGLLGPNAICQYGAQQPVGLNAVPDVCEAMTHDRETSQNNNYYFCGTGTVLCGFTNA
jgi:hypothetical protein